MCGGRGNCGRCKVKVIDGELKISTMDRIQLTEDELSHACATTIHKAQGSEYPIVVMPIMMNNFVMLQRNLILYGHHQSKEGACDSRNEEGFGLCSKECHGNKTQHTPEGKTGGGIGTVCMIVVSYKRGRVNRNGMEINNTGKEHRRC